MTLNLRSWLRTKVWVFPSFCSSPAKGTLLSPFTDKNWCFSNRDGRRDDHPHPPGRQIPKKKKQHLNSFLSAYNCAQLDKLWWKGSLQEVGFRDTWRTRGYWLFLYHPHIILDLKHQVIPKLPVCCYRAHWPYCLASDCSSCSQDKLQAKQH